MKLSLKMKLMVSYGVIALFLVVSLLLISNYMLEHHFQIYVQQKQEHINQNYVAAIADEFEKNEKISLPYLRRMGDDALKNGMMLMVFDEAGTQLYCAECEDKEKCDKMVNTMRETMQQRYSNWQGEYIEKDYPIQNYGMVRLGYYGPFFFNEDDLSFISMINTISLGIAGALLAIALAFGAFMASRIARPIKYVIDRTHEMEQNHYEGRIDFVSGTKEIDSLIGSVNTLAHTLETQQKIKKRMAGDYAHEFRTPLAILQSTLEGMMDGIFEATPERLESCRREILRLSRMTAEIDRLVELEDSNLFLKKEVFDFSSLLRLSIIPFEKDLHDRNIRLKLDAEPCSVNGDKDKISQVIVNIFSNAVKYTDDGGEITIRVKDAGEFLSFMVEDTGLGIEGADLPFIFEYLYRTDRSRARGTGGSGIGLSVVKAIVTAHEGSIEVKSRPGIGSCFTVTLRKG